MIRIPISGQEDMPWGYFVLEAARGGVRVPDWVLLAVPEVVGMRLGKAPDTVDGDDVDAALDLLPDDPTLVLEELLALVDQPVPEAGKARPLLEKGHGRGSFRDAVDEVALLHDAALRLRSDYGRDGFYTCMDAVEDPDTWDATCAVAAMMYLLLLQVDAAMEVLTRGERQN